MKHPDLIAKLLIDVAAEHGHAIAGLTLQRSTLGPHKDFPCYTYGIQAIETIAGANWPDELRKEQEWREAIQRGVREAVRQMNDRG